MPTLVPSNDATVYTVLEDFGKLGCVWREIDQAEANEEAVIAGILIGEYEHVARVVAFNTDQNWARDVSEEIAAKLVEAGRKEGCELGASARAFTERFGREVPTGT